MKLEDLLARERIVLPLKARTVRDATRRLVRALVEAGAVRDRARLEAMVQEAWPEDIVNVGAETMLPHFRTDAVPRTTVALGVSPKPICRERDPKRCARIVVLVVSPPTEASTYLQVVSAFARALGQESLVQQLLDARTPEEVLALEPLRAVQLPGRLQVRDLMTASVLSLTSQTPLRDAAQLMVQHSVQALPVVDEAGSVIGMLTDRELMKHLMPQYLQRESTGEFPVQAASAGEPPPDPGEVLVREVMARSVLCLREDQSLADAANLMVNKDRDRFPVVRDGVLVGFLTRADVVRRLLALQP